MTNARIILFLFLEGQSSQYWYCESGNDMGALAPFTKTDIINIPDAIFDQYNQTESFTRMGLFPEIERAWITVDNRLYFWNYRNGSDFLTFEDIPHTIISINLVKPKPGTFIDSVNHLLVLCTPLEVYLLAVTYANDELQLFDTGMVVTTKGLDVSTIVGSKTTGRIFFCGDGDGINIWEIVYSNVETWFRGKCSKICHTRNGVAAALSPSFSGFGIDTTGGFLGSLMSAASPENITAMEVDDSRSLLYTLSSKSTIRVYHITGKQELNLTITYTLTQLLSHLQMITAPADPNNNTGGGATSNNFANSAQNSTLIGKSTKIVSIHVISKIESSQIHLVAITSTGCRLYLRAARSMVFGFASNANSPPTTMQVIQVRFPPASDMNTPPSQSKLLTSTKPTSAIFEPGHFFGVVPNENSENNNGDKLFVASLDSGRIVHQMSATPVTEAPMFIENACFLPVEGFVQSIRVLTPPFKASDKPEGFGNECAAQYSFPAPQIAVLTNTGIQIFTRNYPYQVFAGLGQDVRTFFEFYGRTETCSSALSVASKGSIGAADERELATKVYIEVGGKPHLKVDDENTYSLTNSTNPATPGNNNSTGKGEDIVRLSGRFDGLATYLSRMLREIWSKKVFNFKENSSQPNERGVFSISVSQSTLELIQIGLFEISEFLEKNRAFIDGLSGGPDSLLGSASRADEISLQVEHRGLDALVRLIKSVREGIAFLLLLIEETVNASNGVEAIMAYLQDDIRLQMKNLVFKKFFTTTEGTDLAKELVTCLVNRSIAEGGSVDSIARVLQDRCESYCSSNDVITYKALEYLRKAKVAPESDADLKNQNLYDSVRLFKKAAAETHFQTLKEAMQEYEVLEFYPGAVEVGLSVAGAIDRGNFAVGYLHDGKPATDSRKGLYERRLEIYELIFSVLDNVDNKAEEETAKMGVSTDSTGATTRYGKLRDETYSICFSSTDEVFHFSFYDWFFSKGLENRLLDINTPFILSYLQTNAKTNFDIADLLWVYLQKHEDYYGAAQVLFDLARGDFEISLGQRIEFLSRGRGYCNCSCPPNLSQAMVQLGEKIQEYMDIASIQDEILRAVKEDERFEQSKRDEAVRLLDGKILGISELFNDFADPLEYYEICLSIFQVTDYRGADEINRCWMKLIQGAPPMGEDNNDDNNKGYEYVSNVVQRLGQQFMLAEFVFPTDFLVPLLETYGYENAPNAPQGWVVDTFLNAGLSSEALYAILNDLLERKEYPFDEDLALKKLAMDIIYLLERWSTESRGRYSVMQVVDNKQIDQLTAIAGQKEMSNLKRLKWN